jgi:hypothetical protein
MSRVILLVLTAATLAACSEAGPYGYGYAVNGRQSLWQLSATPGDTDNSFRTDAPTAAPTTDTK